MHELKQQIAAATTTAASAVATAQAATSNITAQTGTANTNEIVQDATNKFHEHDTKFKDFMAKMHAFETQVTKDQTALRDKLKAQALKTDQQIHAINERCDGIFKTIQANATIVAALQVSITDMSTRMESFIAQQVLQMANDKLIQAEAAAQQTKMFKMLASIESRTPSGEAQEKKHKGEEAL